MDGRPRLLVVEDDAALRGSLLAVLAQHDFEVRAAPDGSSFAGLVRDFRPDLALLDIGLPGDEDGFDLAAALAGTTSVPFLFITAADALPDRLRGFALGADDYLVKPFSMSELLARIRAVLRRSGRLVSAVHIVRDLVIDESEREVVRAGVRVEVTHTEFEVLAALAPPSWQGDVQGSADGGGLGVRRVRPQHRRGARQRFAPQTRGARPAPDPHRTGRGLLARAPRISGHLRPGGRLGRIDERER
jgi:DNA-binding response OmpR family regulator